MTETATAPTPRERPAWMDLVEPYEAPSWSKGLLCLLTSLVPYLVLTVVMYLTLEQLPWWATGLIAIPAGGFLVRTFIVFHDATHGSFLPNRDLNNWVGRLCGLLVFAPFARWKASHQAHHGSAGDLDRRGHGDVHTLTIDEYNERGFGSRLAYRLFRNPVVMFGLGPLGAMVIAPRLLTKGMRKSIRNSVLLTNLALVALIGGLCWLFGWQAYLAVAGPVALIAGASGIWLFYVQHQFEDVYWERSELWDFTEAALRGSSFLDLPPILRFFSGNIGYHHVHHLSARIPNYNLKQAHEEIDLFEQVPVLTLGEALRCTRFKLIDGETGRLCTFAEARAISTRRASSAKPAEAAA